ncbi:MAG: hypothetical protein AB1813_05835 [Verrucomicrobiota bacterium]|jgi:chromosome segregation ATPase
MADPEPRSWSRFNADFKVPESQDAARIAHEVKASIDSWIQSSLSQLESQMSERMKVQLAEFERNIAATNAALKSVDEKIAGMQAAIGQLASSDPELARDIERLKRQTEETRKAMQAAAEKWEQYGKQAVDSAIKVAKTVATFV